MLIDIGGKEIKTGDRLPYINYTTPKAQNKNEKTDCTVQRTRKKAVEGKGFKTAVIFLLKKAQTRRKRNK